MWTIQNPRTTTKPASPNLLHMETFQIGSDNAPALFSTLSFTCYPVREYTPHVLTVVGFLVASAAGIAIAAGKCFLGGWLLLISGPFDALDGALARATGRESRFGAFLDSSLDRYSEAAVLFGVLFWSSSNGHHALVLLCFMAMVGSIMVSYTRARAEGLNMACKVGVFTRMERFVVMIVMLLTEQLGIGLALLAVLANVTAIQRIVHVYRKSLK